MSEKKLSCPGCASAVPPRSVALELQIECPSCRTRLRVPILYQANFMMASFVLGLVGAWMAGAEQYFVPLTFFLAFVFALFLATTVLPLIPPRLER